jgi:hypothetical protein
MKTSIPEGNDEGLLGVVAPSFNDVALGKMNALRLQQNATEFVVRWEECVRQFMNDFQHLDSMQLREKLEFAASDLRFPVVAEWRMSFGLARGSSIESDVAHLANDLGFRASWKQFFCSVVSYDTEAHLAHILDQSPAIQDLRGELEKYNLDLMIATGYGYTCVTPDKLLRLLIVLKGTRGIKDPDRYHLLGELYDNPVLMGVTTMPSR